MSLLGGSWKLRVELHLDQQRTALKGFWEIAGRHGTAWKPALIEPGRPDCYSGFAIDLPCNQMLDDVREQWKEKGLGWLLSCEFSNALNMEPHSCLCFVSLDFQCNVLDFTLEAIVNAHSSLLSMLHGVLLPFYRPKPHLTKKREWSKSSPFLAMNSQH